MSVIDGEKEICVGLTTSGKVIMSVGPCEKIIERDEAEKLLAILTSALNVAGADYPPDKIRLDVTPETAGRWVGRWFSGMIPPYNSKPGDRFVLRTCDGVLYVSGICNGIWTAFGSSSGPLVTHWMRIPEIQGVKL